MLTLNAADVQRFRTAISQRLGLSFEDSKLAYLGEVLERRTQAFAGPGARYLDLLEGAEPLLPELRALSQELTVPETYFFRNIDQFRALAEIALPERLSARSGSRRLSLLSAGCASGEEAYSLAMVAKDRILEPGWEVSIRALDINPAPLAKAAQGRYSAWALRETPPEDQRRWFRAEGRDFVLDPGIQSAVRFEERNLIHDASDVWQTGVHDVVFCRNVLMYFTSDHMRAVVQRIARSLAPGGYLFLGHAETLRGVSQDFHLRHTHGTFYYQRKERLDGVSIEAHSEVLPLPLVNPPPVTDGNWATTWIETVQRAASRIESLATLSAPAAPGAMAPQAGGIRWQLGLALALLKEERFADALELLRNLPPELLRDPDALLLRAVLLTHSGQLDAAEGVCRELLVVDELNGAAHYLLALCREGAGDLKGAMDHDQVATYLDPSFAMPRFHLGLMARRADQPETARRELAQALTLLQREEGARIIFFGGGFSREALVALCRAELSAAGGKA